jgi:type IV secretory pathway VirB2 component (pilin)
MTDQRENYSGVLVGGISVLAAVAWLVGPLGFIFAPVALVAAGVLMRRRGHQNAQHIFYIAAMLYVFLAAFIYLGLRSADTGMIRQTSEQACRPHGGWQSVSADRLVCRDGTRLVARYFGDPEAKQWVGA